MAKNNSVTEKYVTGKGELVGYLSLTKPSTKFKPEGTYLAHILLEAEEGKKLEARVKELRTTQYKTYGKGTKIQDLPIAPYVILNEEEGTSTPDPQGRYLLKTKGKAFIKNGKIGRKLNIINAKKHPVKNVSIGEGTIARLGVTLSGYSVAGKTGVSVELGVVQIIKLVEYTGGGISLDAFDIEDGFDGVGEEFEPELTSDVAEEEDSSEEDFGY